MKYWTSCCHVPPDERFYKVSDIYNNEHIGQFVPVPPDGSYEWLDQNGKVLGSITHWKDLH